MGVDVGNGVAVGGSVAVGVPGVGVEGGGAPAPHAERTKLRAINKNSVGRMCISREG